MAHHARGRGDIETGWRHLRSREWGAARAAFEAALAAQESPEALEGLSWAAWWLDDGPAVFSARERAFGLYRERREDAAAARMAVWLAADQLDFHGAVAVAQGWLQRAHRLLDGHEVCPEHGWLAFHEGFLAHHAGETGRAAELADTAAAIGRRLGIADLEMLGLALRGAGLVAGDDVGDGMRCLDEATAIALQDEASIPISGAWTFCFTVSACTAVGDYDRAAEWCDRIAEFAERHGSRYMLAFCRGDYGLVDVWRGRWHEAAELLEASAADYARSRPALAGGSLAMLAELRRRQGRRGDAAALADQAGGSMDAQLCRARLALDGGRPVEAAELAERVLRRLPAPARPGSAAALEVLVAARLEAGDLDGAAAAAADLRGAERAAGTPALQAAADLAEGRVALARGDAEEARPRLEDAVDGFASGGAPYETALARTALAEALHALDRPQAASREAAAAAAALDELGAGPAATLARALAGGAEPGETGAPQDAVTPREREVLALLAEGLTNREIAGRLVVSEHTVHRHVTNILRKLDVPSRAAAAAHAVRSGLTGESGP